MNDQRPFRFIDRLRSFTHAIRGIRYLLTSQHNAQLHFVVTMAVIVAGLAFNVSADQWCWLIVAIVMVWVAEAMNTAIEYLADALHPEHHPLIGKAKDIAAGAVLIAAIGAVAIGLIVFIPHAIKLLQCSDCF